MKLKTIQIINAYTVLQTLAKEELSFRASFLIGSNVSAMEPIIEAFMQQERAILDKYGAKDENSELIVTKKEGGSAETVQLTDAPAYTAAINELGSCVIDIPVNKMELSMFDGAAISPADMYQILFLFESDQTAS